MLKPSLFYTLYVNEELVGKHYVKEKWEVRKDYWPEFR